MNVLGRIFLNYRKKRRKDVFFLWDVEELTLWNIIKRMWPTQFTPKYIKSDFDKKN